MSIPNVILMSQAINNKITAVMGPTLEKEMKAVSNFSEAMEKVYSSTEFTNFLRDSFDDEKAEVAAVIGGRRPAPEYNDESVVQHLKNVEVVMKKLTLEFSGDIPATWDALTDDEKLDYAAATAWIINASPEWLIKVTKRYEEVISELA